MATKTLTVTEEAYEAVKSLKHEHESFSDLFKRLAGKQLRVKDIVGLLKHTSEESEAWKRRIFQYHKELGKDWQKRTDYVHSSKIKGFKAVIIK